MRYFPRGGKIQRILLYDWSFYKEDSMMKRKQSVLMMAVMTALLTPNFGGCLLPACLTCRHCRKKTL